RRRDPRPARPTKGLRHGHGPPPYRAAARKARLIRRAAAARRTKAISPPPDKAVRHRDRAATARPLRVAPPAVRSPRGSRKPDRSGPAPTIGRARRDNPKGVVIAAAPAFPRQCRARRGLGKSPRRTP